MMGLLMATAVLTLLLLLASTLASGIEMESKVCGGDHLAYASVDGLELVYINGSPVGKDVFCEILHFHYTNDCLFENFLGSSYCKDDLHLRRARELLQKEVKGESTVQDAFRKEKETGPETLPPGKTVGIAAAGVLSLCCLIICPCFYKKRREPAHNVLEKDVSMNSVSSTEGNCVTEKVLPGSPLRVPPSPLRVPPSPSRFSNSPKLSRLHSVHLTMSQVARATRNFSSSLQIGEGGFGTVYKARLEDGQVVAIKRGKKEHFDNLRTEFSSEVELLAKIDHRNLVKLLGYIDRGNERIIITEYVPNGTLREHLDGQRGKILDFNQRLEISIDVAHALTYLHLYAEKQIIHRDVKSSNILLTESMRAKVADFGFARLGPVDSEHTHISTKVKGTVGYLDPEYMRTYQLTPKSDVFSFGILLLEILTGRRPVEIKKPQDERVTVRWAFGKYGEGLVSVLVDPLLEERVDTEVLNKMFSLAFECAAPVRSDRPDMKVVGERLWGIRADYLKSVKKG